jgi:hypothetical protein
MGRPKAQAPSRAPGNTAIAARVGLSGWIIGTAVWGAFAVLVWAFATGV